MSNRDQVLQVARSQIGVTEQGRNVTKYGAWFGMNGQPWCAIFVDWVYTHAGLPDLRQVVTPYWASTIMGTQAAHAKGYLKPVSWAAPGDIAMWNLPGGDRVDHTSIVESNNGSTLTCIDGNWGDRVQRVTHASSQCVGIVRIPQLDKVTVPPAVANQVVDWAAVRRYGAAMLLPWVQALGDVAPLGPTHGTDYQVRTLQKALNYITGRGLTEDGIYGDQTIRAVVDFQGFLGIKDVFPGVAGQPTIFVLCCVLMNIRDGK